jgi:serine/threonine protein kinase
MSSNDRGNKPPAKIDGGKYEMDKRLGAGCFGEVWRGRDTATKAQVAVKFESAEGRAPQLEQEADILRLLAKPSPQQGFAEVFYWGREGRFNCVVMELLGRSLEDMVQHCKGKFTPQTALLCAEQVLCRIEYLHSKGIIHRDIKPENFMFGIKDKVHHIYLIDFGLSKRYFDMSQSKHISMRQNLNMTGTARYASVNAHKGKEQSRRDDLEAIGHMLLYFLRGALPWSGLSAKTQEEKYRKIREKKEETPLAELCQGFPDAFRIYLDTARKLEFKERPDYDGYRKLFRDARAKFANLQDHDFQWNEGKDLRGLVPLAPARSLRQPDDEPVSAQKSGGGGCFPFFCGSKSNVRD